MPASARPAGPRPAPRRSGPQALTLGSEMQILPKRPPVQLLWPDSVVCWRLLERLAGRRMPMAGVFQVKKPQQPLAPRRVKMPQKLKQKSQPAQPPRRALAGVPQNAAKRPTRPIPRELPDTAMPSDAWACWTQDVSQLGVPLGESDAVPTRWASVQALQSLQAPQLLLGQGV